MWKAAFTGRSERNSKADETPSTTGRSERRRHRSGSDVQSVVSSASRRTDGDRRRKSEARREPSVSYGAAPVRPSNGPGGVPARSLTESAVNAFNAHRDRGGEEEEEWEDEDGKSVGRSRRGDDGERRKRRERDESRDREGKRRESRVSGLEKARGKAKREDIVDSEGERSRAIPAMGSFEQFPGMYDAAIVGPPEHTMSGGLPFDPHVQAQFPGQNPSTHARPAFDLNPHGAAADYYGDMGESVKRQPGIRASTPMMLHNPDMHLVTPSAATQPAEDTGQGAAADYYGAATTIPLDAPSSSGRPSKPTKHSSSFSTTKASKKPGRTNSKAAVTATAAALGGAAANTSQHHSHRHSSASSSYYNTIPPVPAPTESNFTAPPPASTNNPYRPTRHNSEPVSVPGGGYYTAPSAVSGKPGKSSPPRSAHTGLYTAAGAAAAYGLKARHDTHHTGRSEVTSTYDGPSPRGPDSQFGASYYGPQSHLPPTAPSTYYNGPAPPATPLGMEHRHEHRGPISRLKDGVLNLISSPDDVRRMEEYTEYIGVCKYCFDPRSSPSQGPRKHHYHPRRDSFETLRRRSLERLRRRGSGDSLRGKINKDSRYYPDRKGVSKTDLLAGGVAAAGAAGAASAYFNDRKDFDDTYSVKSGHRAGSAYRRRSRSSSVEHRRRATHGVVGYERRDEYVTVRTKDGRLEKRRVHRSRSRSADRKSGWMGAAALAGGSVAAASSRRRDSSPERVFVRHASHSHSHASRSRSRSHSPGLGEIFGFSVPPSSRRGRRASPNSSTYDISRPATSTGGGGMLGGFFSPPEKKEKGKEKKGKKGHRKAKSAGGFFTFSNGSSSSSNSELAFGEGFSGRSSVGRSSSGRKKVARRNSDEKFNKTMLGIGATAAALAAAQKGSKMSKRPSRSEVGRRDSRVRRTSSANRYGDAVEDDEWEDELPSDAGSDASSGLAFGSDAPRRRLSGQSMESLNSTSSASGLGAWGWRWGGKKQRSHRRRTPSPQPSYPATPDPTVLGPVAASIAAGSAIDAYGRRVPSESSGSGLANQPLQVVDPRPVSDYSSMPGGWDDEPVLATGRPGAAPLQAPQPITPIPATFTTSAGFDEALRPTAGPGTDAHRPSGPRRSVSSPVQPAAGSSGGWMQDAALIGGAALATGSIIASQGQGRRSKEPGSVRFGFTEEQQRKVDKEIMRERDREEEERRRKDRTRALKEEAERVGREGDERRSRAEVGRERERRERDAAALKGRESAAPKRESEEEALLRESREREEAYRREQVRFAEESRRRFEDQQRADAEGAKREAEERLAAERREQQERAEREAAERKDERKDKGKGKKGDRKRGESVSSKSWQGPVAAAGAGALAGAVLEGALHKDARDARSDSTPRETKSRSDDPPFITQPMKPTFSHSGAPITDDDLIDPDFFKRRPSAADRNAHEELARKAAQKVVEEREDYYHEPVQTQRDFFMPKELLDREAKGKERAGDPAGDNDVRVFNAAEPSYDKEFGKSGSEVSARQGIPRLNLIAPTPPHSVAGSVKGDRSIPPSPLVEQEKAGEDDAKSTTSSRRPSSGRGISWGEDTTHVYQVRTPDSWREGEGYMAQQEPSPSAKDPGITVEVEDGGEGAPEVTLNDILRGVPDAGAGSRQPFAASVSDFTTPQTPGTEGAPPVQGWIEGETNESTPKEERGERMPGGFEDAVYAQTTREGRPESAFTHHDSREIDPNAKVPGEEAEWAGLSKKERKKREKAAKRGEALDSEVAIPGTELAEPMDGSREAQPEPEPAWEPPLSKKEQKKRDKAAKKGEAFAESEPSTPAAEPEVAAPEAEAAWEPPLSKKEQKKRDKAAKMAAAFDEPEPAFPAAERGEPEVEVAAPAIEEPQEAAWEPPLSKKEQKKRDKASKLASTFDNPHPDSEPIIPSTSRSEPGWPAQEPEEEAAWEAPLSKKEQKKREKEAKKQGFADVATELMTAGGVAAVVDAASKSEGAEEGGKKSKKKLGEPIDDDPRDVEPVATIEPSNMTGVWEQSPTPAAEEPQEVAVSPQEAPTVDEWGGVESKKSKKKKKRDSSRFNEPTASSPLRSEVAFDDYVGGSKAEVAPYSNGYSKEAENVEKDSRSNYFDDEKRVSESPRATSPDDAMGSVVSAPSDERRRSKSSRSRRESEYRDDEPYAFDDTRSVAASEPAGVYDAKSSKRRSRHHDDDTASVTSSRSKRDKDESPSAKKEKKGGFFGLFSRKSSDGVPLSRTSTKDSKDGKDREDDEERRERRHRRRHTGSEIGVDDDKRSNVSSSSRRHRRDHDERGEDSRERDRNRHRESYDGTSRHGSGSRHASRHSVDDPDRPRHHRRHRSDGLEDSADQSFLGKRVEGLPPLPASRPASTGAAPVSEEQVLGTPAPAAQGGVDRTVSGEDPSQQGLETTGPQNGDCSAQGGNQDLPRLETSVSRPSSPTEYFHQRPVPPTRPLSSTAVPLRFRQPGSSPMAQKQRSTSFSSPVEALSTASPTSPPKSKPSRHEFRNSAEIRPLFLVSRNAKIEDVEEQLPSLPSSKPSSRASSAHGSEDWHSAAEDAEDISDSPTRPKGLKIDPNEANRYVPSEDVLGSQQTTPKAVEMEDPLTARHYPRSEPQYYTWDDFQQDERLREKPAEAAIDFGRPPLGQTTPSMGPEGEQKDEGSPTRMSKKDKKKMKGLAAAAMLGGGAGALLASGGSDEKKDLEQPEEAAKATTEEGAPTEQPSASENQKPSDTTDFTPDANINTDDIWGDAEGDIIARPVVHREVPVEDRLPEKPALSRKASKKKGKKGKAGPESHGDSTAEPTTSASFVEPEADFDDWFGSGSTQGAVTENQKAETPKTEEVAGPATPAAEPEVPSALFERGGGGKAAKKKGKKGKRQSQSEAPADETQVAATAESTEPMEASAATQDNVGATESGEQPSNRGLDDAEAVVSTDKKEPTSTVEETAGPTAEPQPADAIQNGELPETSREAPTESTNALAAPQEAEEDAFAPTLTRKQSKKSKKKQKAQAFSDDTPTEPSTETDRGIEQAEQPPVEPANQESPQSPEFQDALDQPATAPEDAQPSLEVVVEPQDEWSAPASTKKGKKAKKGKRLVADPWADTPAAGDEKGEASAEGSEAFQDGSQESAVVKAPVEVSTTIGDSVEPTDRDMATGTDATAAQEVAEPEKAKEASTGRSWFPWSWSSKKTATEEKSSEPAVESAPLEAKPAEDATAGAESGAAEEQIQEASREAREQPPAVDATSHSVEEPISTELTAPAETLAETSVTDAPQLEGDSAKQTTDSATTAPETSTDAIPEASAEQQQAAEDNFWAAPVSKKKGKKSKKSAAKDDSETQKTVEPEPAEQTTGQEAAEPQSADQTAGTEAGAAVEAQPAAPKDQDGAGQDNPGSQPPADDASFWTPEPSKKKKKKGKKSVGESISESASPDATNEPPASTEDTGPVNQPEDAAPAAGSAEVETAPPSDGAKPEDPAPDAEAESFWTPPTSKKNAKKNKKAALESVEETPAGEDPFGTEPQTDKQAEVPQTATEEPSAETPSNDQTTAEQTLASDEKTEQAPAETQEDFWTTQPKGKKDKKDKRNKSAQAEETPTTEETPTPETPAPEEPKQSPAPAVETVGEQTAVPADARQPENPTDAQQPPQEAAEEDLWALPAKGKKSKKGKKNKQAQAEEAPAPEETPAQDETPAPEASTATPVPAPETAEEQNPTSADAGDPETQVEPQQAPQEAAEEDLWALPSKGKKNKKAKKGKRDSDVQEIAPAESAQDPVEPSNADEAPPSADPVEAPREDNAKHEAEATSIDQPEEATNTEAIDDWSSFGTGKKGKKAKKAHKAALEAQADQLEEADFAQREGANQDDTHLSAENTQPTEQSASAEAVIEPSESTDPSGAREIPPADLTQDVVASDPAPDPAVVEQQTPQPSSDGASEAPPEDADFFAPAKKSKKDKKKAKKAAAAATLDEGLAGGDAEAQKPNEDGMEGQPMESSESVPAENPNFEQTEPEAIPDDAVVAKPETRVEEPIEADAFSTSAKKSKKDNKRAKKAANWADDEPAAEQTEILPETDTTPQAGAVESSALEPSATEPSTVEPSAAEPSTVEPSTAELPATDSAEGTATTQAGPTEGTEGPLATDHAAGGSEPVDPEPVSAKKSKKEKKKAKKAGLWELGEPQTENVEARVATDEGAAPAEPTDDSAVNPEATDTAIPAGPQAENIETTLTTDENAAPTEPSGETSRHPEMTDPTTTAEPQPIPADAAGEETAQDTSAGADQEVETGSKKSKKDKKKAKKAVAFEFESAEPASHSPDDVQDNTAPAEASSEQTVEQSKPMSELTEIQQPAAGVNNAVPFPEAEKNEAKEVEWAPTKKSKKDKKKAKKAATWEPEESASPAAEEPSATEETQPLPADQDKNMDVPASAEQVEPAGAKEAEPPRDEPQEEADEAPVSTKKSKKDKKKAKKASALGFDEPEHEAEKAPTESLGQDQDSAALEPKQSIPSSAAQREVDSAAVTETSVDVVPEEPQPPVAEADNDDQTLTLGSSKKSKNDKRAKKAKSVGFKDFGEEPGAPTTEDQALPPFQDKVPEQTTEGLGESPDAPSASAELPQNEETTLGTALPGTDVLSMNAEDTTASGTQGVDEGEQHPEATQSVGADQSKGLPAANSLEETSGAEAAHAATEPSQPAETELTPPEKTLEPSTEPSAAEASDARNGEPDKEATDDFGSVSTKKGKKDKKKAKKAKAADRDSPQLETDVGGENSALDKAAEGVPETAPLVEDAPPTETAPVSEEAPANDETPATEATEDFGFSSKKSKKDKKKAKKSKASEAGQADAEGGGKDEPAAANDGQDTELAPTQEVAPGAFTVKDTTVGDGTMVAESSTEPTEQPAGERGVLEEPSATGREDTPAEPQGRDNTNVPDPTNQPVTSDAPAAQLDNTSGQDIDFAATLAAGLADSGFNPNLVVDDPDFHRRDSPPAQTAEANPEEAFPGPGKKNKKKGKGKKDAAADEIFGEENKPDDFEATLSKGLQDSGFDAALLAGAVTAEAEPTAGKLKDEEDERLFATPKKNKKGKKGKKGVEDSAMTDDPATPPVDDGASTPADASTADKTIEGMNRAPEPTEITQPPATEAGATDNPAESNEPEASQPEQPGTTETPANNEAEPDEWALPIKKKGKKGKKQRDLAPEDLEAPQQPSDQAEASAEPMAAEPTADTTEPALSQPEGSRELGEGAILADTQADTTVELQEAGEDEWAAPTKKKKGKKGKRKQDAESEEQPATVTGPTVGDSQESASKPAAAENTTAGPPPEIVSEDVKVAEDDSANSPNQPIQSETSRELAPMPEDQPMPTDEAQLSTQPPATEAGEDDWAPSTKKKGKKGKKGKERASAADAERIPFAAPEQSADPTPAAEATEALAPPSGEGANEPGLVGGGEMDIDEMDKAYKAYKKNKRKQKKMKGAAGEGDGEQTPAEPQDPEKPVEVAAEPAVVTEEPAQQDRQSRHGPPSSTGATTGDPNQPNERSRVAPPSSTGATTGLDSAEQVTGPDGSPLSPSRVQSLFPGLQRVKRRAPSINKSAGEGNRGDVVVHTSEVSQNLPRGVEKSPSRQSKDTQGTARSNDDVFAPEASERPGAALGLAGAVAGATAPTWSFDGLDEHEKQPGTDREIPTIRKSTTMDGSQGRRPTPPLHIDTGSPEDRARDVSKKREGDGLEASAGKHARTPSYETPLESMSRNRASYLFQSPPDAAATNDDAADPKTPDRRSDNAEQSQPRSMDCIAKEANELPLSPPPASPMSPRPLDTIPEEANAHKRHLAASNMATTDRAEKSQRRTGTPKAIRDNPLSPVTSRQATNPPSRSVSTPINETNLRALPSDENRPSKRVVSDHRSPSAMSNRSAIAHKTPEERRSISGLSNRSSTQSLRRVNMSGDLRAASRASNKRGNASEAGSAGGAKTIPPFEPPPTPPLNEDEFDGGASRATNMADFYQGYGDAQGSQVSPTRPPSVRKRQSMHIMELESKLEHLNSENAALQNARMGFQGQNVDGASLQQALEYRDLQLREKDNEIEQVRAMLEPMQQEISRLMEMNGGLSEANRNLVEEGNGKYSALQAEHAHAQQQWQDTSRELGSMREEHGKLTTGMREAIAAQLTTAMAEKDHEIRKLKEDLEVASERIRALQVQIQSSKGNDFLVYRDEDYFDGACQKLCQHVQQWVVRFSKISDSRICRLSSDLKDDKLETRLDNALLDGTDVDKLLGDRVRRRDVFMSVVMTMVWEYVFTRYLFGMDREQRQKLKQLEKILSEVGPPRAVAQWRATTLTLLSKRPTFAKQCSLDTEAVAHEIFGLLRALLPPPSSHETQLLTSLQKVIGVAVDLSIEMRTQRAEYIMLPPLQPEYDTNGDLVRKVTFNASLMNERSGAYTSNEDLEKERAVVKIVLFPLVVKKGDESGEGEEEIVVCPAQVLVHNDGGRARKVVRVMSGAMEIDERRGSRMSLVSERPGSTQMF